MIVGGFVFFLFCVVLSSIRRVYVATASALQQLQLRLHATLLLSSSLQVMQRSTTAPVVPTGVAASGRKSLRLPPAGGHESFQGGSRARLSCCTRKNCTGSKLFVAGCICFAVAEIAVVGFLVAYNWIYLIASSEPSPEFLSPSDGVLSAEGASVDC